MVDPLAGIVGKLDRGFHHLEEVEPCIGSFLEDKPWHIAYEPDEEPGWVLARFFIDRYPPLEWSIVIGEAFGQFHSSLDHLMTELAILRRPQLRRTPNRSPNFPICSRPGEFWSKPARGQVPADRVGREVRPEHFTELQRLQPRKSEDLSSPDRKITAARALQAIRLIDNMNKHATLSPAFIGPKKITYYDMNIYRLLDGFSPIYTPLNRMYHGTKLYRAKFKGEPDVDVAFRIEPEISFGIKPLDWVTRESIRACGEWVRRIVERFREITPEFRA